MIRSLNNFVLKKSFLGSSRRPLTSSAGVVVKSKLGRADSINLSNNNIYNNYNNYNSDVQENVNISSRNSFAVDSESGNYITEELLKTLPDVEQFVRTIKPKLKEDFPLISGRTIPKEAIQIKYATFGRPALNKKIILLCPSMSNSVFAVDQRPGSYNASTGKIEFKEEGGSQKLQKGWWRGVIGYGDNYGIDLNQFYVVCASPLGSPFGSTSPLTYDPNKENVTEAKRKMFGPNFPQITPADQALLHKILLDELNIPKVFAVIGGSMGGMQAIQFAARFPERYDNFAAIAATAQTSPGIVALRFVQRQAVKTDPEYHNGFYYLPEFNSKGPQNGLKVARMFGTICYRSHQEFNSRFSWTPAYIDAGLLSTGRASTESTSMENSADSEAKSTESNNHAFEMERYLQHQADIFIERSNYDANCYLLLSKSMDLMNAFNNDGVRNIDSSKHALLLSYSTDKLTPPEDLERLSSELGKNGVNVHYEVLESEYGHDAFLIERESSHINMRIRAFLEGGVHPVQKLVKEILHS